MFRQPQGVSRGRMKRGPSIAKILDTRNLKAVKLRYDVRAEHKHYQTLKDADNATWSKQTPPPQNIFVKREEAALNPLDTWMS